MAGATDVVYGAAARYVQQRFGGNFRVRQTAVPVDAAQAVAAPNDPDRVALVIFNTGATQITIGYQQPVVSGVGVLLLANGSSYSVNVEQDSILPAWPHYCIGNGAGGTLFVVEVLLEGKP